MVSFNPSALLTRVSNFQADLASLSSQAANLVRQLIPWVEVGLKEQNISNLSCDTRSLAENLHNEVDLQDLTLQRIREERNKDLSQDEVKVLEKIYSHYSAKKSNGQDRMPLLNNLLAALDLDQIKESTRNEQRKKLKELFSDSIASNEHRFCFQQRQKVWQSIKTQFEMQAPLTAISSYGDLKENKFAVIDGICGTIGRRLEASDRKSQKSERISTWDKSLWMNDEVIEIAVKAIAHFLRA